MRTVTQLDMLWRDPSEHGTTNPREPIVLGKDAKSIEELPARGEGDCWSWLVTWEGEEGNQSRYFRAFSGGGLGVVAVHYKDVEVPYEDIPF